MGPSNPLSSDINKNHFILPFGIHVRAPPFLVPLAKLSHGISYTSPRLPALFLSREPRLEAASSREIAQHARGPMR